MSTLPADCCVARVHLFVCEPCPGGNMEHRGVLETGAEVNIELAATDVLITVSIVTISRYLLRQPLPGALGGQCLAGD